MKTCKTLDEIVSYILRYHQIIRDKGPTGGVCASKLLRKPGGKRIAFEENINWRIFKWTAAADGVSLRVDSIVTGFAFRGQTIIQQTSRLFLTDLIVVNVYDFAAEFFSKSSIDFAYTLNTPEAAIEHTYEVLRGKPGNIRARWVADCEDIEKVLDDFNLGLHDVPVDVLGRNVEMNFGEF